MKMNRTNMQSVRAVWANYLGFLALLGGLSFSPDVFGQTKGDVVISLVVRTVSVGKDGRETLRPAERAFPGDVVQYDASYKNQGAAVVSHLEPTLPIPAGLEFIPETASPRPTLASVNGREFAPYPLTRKQTMPDRTVRLQPVPFSEYRALRWSVGDLGAGKTTAVSARARIASNRVASR